MNEEKLQELYGTLKGSGEKYNNLFEEYNRNLDEISEIKQNNKELNENLERISQKYSNSLQELDVCKEQYEKLLRQYSDAREELEKDLKRQQKSETLEEKIIDLEAELVISKSKSQKYKKLLNERNILSPVTSSPASSRNKRQISISDPIESEN